MSRKVKWAPFDFERWSEPLAPPDQFGRRLMTGVSLAGAVIAVSLGIGVLGYHYLAGITSWVDALYNASMILGGMGPVDPLPTARGKLFASAYAIYSGVTLLASVGVMLSPAVHRVLHRMHVETDEDREGERK